MNRKKTIVFTDENGKQKEWRLYSDKILGLDPNLANIKVHDVDNDTESTIDDIDVAYIDTMLSLKKEMENFNSTSISRKIILVHKLK